MKDKKMCPEIKLTTENKDKPLAIVTGGGKGIGAACCKALYDKGFRVGIHYNSSMKQAKDALNCINNEGFILQADLSDTNQIEDMIRAIKNVSGTVDVLVNNAGMSINESINSMKIDAFDAQRSILRGVWYLTKRILRTFMLRQPSGKIINISSVVVHTGNAGQIPYTMEKAALDAMTKSLAKELWGRNILVNSVAPGFIDTDMTGELTDETKQSILNNIPLSRIGAPEEVAQVVAFLAESATYINGSIIHVNGGMYCA
jgi:3-oxoacyl-[acyl-carrier protein] reductase